jgi:DNA-binding transcriptional MerR regulator
MYTIGQLSRICQVTPKALRHYEEIGLLRPAHVDRFNQYRYYSTDQVELVRLIRIARDTGMSLARIKEFLRARDQGESVGGILEAHRQDLLVQMTELNGRLARLSWWQNKQEAGRMKSESKYAVVLRELPEVLVRCQRKAIGDFPVGLGGMFEAVYGEILQAGRAPAGPPFVLYYDEEFNPERVDVEVAFPVSDPAIATRTIPATSAATTVHVGPYDKLADAYAAVYGWANDNGYESVLPMRDVYTNDPENTPPDQLVTEVILPVRSRE